MANDPVIPPPDDGSRHIFAEQVTRDAVVSDLQGIRLWGTTFEPGDHAEVDRFGGGTVGPASLHVQTSAGAFGAGNAIEGVTTGVAYNAGDQIGSPASFIGGTKFYALERMFFQILDLDKVLDDTAHLWLIDDTVGDGSGWGDGGDATPIDIAGAGFSSAVAMPVADVADTQTCRYLKFLLDIGFTVRPTTGFVIDCGTATPTFTSGALIVVGGGALRGVIDTPA